MNRSQSTATEPDRAVRAGLFAVAGIGIVASGYVLADLASAHGWHGLSAYALPALIDIPAGVAARIALRRRATPQAARDYARKLTYTLVGLSALLNVVGHLTATETTGRLDTALTVLLGLVAPLVVMATLHLDVLLSGGPVGEGVGQAPMVFGPAVGPLLSDSYRQAVGQVTEQGDRSPVGQAADTPVGQTPDSVTAGLSDNRPEAVRGEVPLPLDSAPERPRERVSAARSTPARKVAKAAAGKPARRTDAEVVAAIRQLDADAGSEVSGNVIRQSLGIGKDRADRLAAEARATRLHAVSE
jgi:hypothetical protein